MSFNDVEFLGGFIHDSVSNSLQEPDSAIPVLEAAVVPLTSICLPTGPRPLFITNIQVLFADVAVTDPNEDRYLGWAVYVASDGSSTPTYAAVTGAAYTANGDLPLILDDSVSGTAIQAVANVPVDLFNYVDATRAATDVMYATQAAMPTESKVSPIRLAANTVYQVRIGTYYDGSLAAVTGLDNVAVMVYGRRV